MKLLLKVTQIQLINEYRVKPKTTPLRVWNVPLDSCL